MNDQTTERNDPAIDPEKKPGEKPDDNSYTPDYGPSELESPDTTKKENRTGETDWDIDTAGG